MVDSMSLSIFLLSQRNPQTGGEQRGVPSPACQGRKHSQAYPQMLHMLIRGGVKIQFQAGNLRPSSSSLSPSRTVFCLMITLSVSNPSPSSCTAKRYSYTRSLPRFLSCKTFSGDPMTSPGGFYYSILGCLVSCLSAFPKLCSNCLLICLPSHPPPFHTMQEQELPLSQISLTAHSLVLAASLASEISVFHGHLGRPSLQVPGQPLPRRMTMQARMAMSAPVLRPAFRM